MTLLEEKQMAGSFGAASGVGIGNPGDAAAVLGAALSAAAAPGLSARAGTDGACAVAVGAAFGAAAAALGIRDGAG